MGIGAGLAKDIYFLLGELLSRGILALSFLEVVSTSYMKPLSTNEVKPDEMKQGKVGDKRVLVVNLNGKLYAIGDVCMHMGCSLSNGTLNGEKVICPCHGSTYNVRTGSVVRGPAKKPEPTFEVKVDGDRIFLKV